MLGVGALPMASVGGRWMLPDAYGLPWRVLDRVHGIEMLLVPPGEYVRGGDPLGEHGELVKSNELPRHKVRITKPFYISRFETSIAEWNSVMVGPPRLSGGAAISGSILSEAVASSIAARLPGLAVSGDEVKQAVNAKIHELGAAGDLQVTQLAAPGAADNWELLSKALSATIEHLIESRARSRNVQVPARAGVASAVAAAVTHYIQTTAHSRGMAKSWRCAHNFLDDQTYRSWQEVGSFLEKTGSLGFDLPTEAQWEYACRAGGSPVLLRNELKSKRAVQPQKAPNGLGLSNMLGGVAEWCRDYMSRDYSALKPTEVDPTGPSGPLTGWSVNYPVDAFRVIRGSSVGDSWYSASQRERPGAEGDQDIGFRLVRQQDALAENVIPYISPDVAAADAPLPPLAWARVVAHDPDPNIVTDPKLRKAIAETKLPWIVEDRVLKAEFLLVPPGKYRIGFSQSSWRTAEGIYLVAGPQGLSRVREKHWSNKMSEHHFGPGQDLNRRRTVRLDKPIYMSRTELRLDSPDEESDPAVATAYAVKHGARIATEDEWEIACRAGVMADNYAYREEFAKELQAGDPGAPKLQDVARIKLVDGQSFGDDGPAQKQPNGLGFYDMIGSFAELCTATLSEGWVYKGGSREFGSLLTLNPWGRQTNRGWDGFAVRLVREP